MPGQYYSLHVQPAPQLPPKNLNTTETLGFSELHLGIFNYDEAKITHTRTQEYIEVTNHTKTMTTHPKILFSLAHLFVTRG